MISKRVTFVLWYQIHHSTMFNSMQTIVQNLMFHLKVNASASFSAHPTEARQTFAVVSLVEVPRCGSNVMFSFVTSSLGMLGSSANWRAAF